MKITINPLPYKYEMKKILSIVLTLAMLLSLSAAAFAEETKAPAISAKDMSFYLNDLDDVKTYPVYFMGDSDVPYFSLADWAELMTYLMHTYIKKDQNISFELSFSMEDNTGVLTREDGYPAYFDCDADSVYFWDYDAFQRPDEDRVLIDILGVGNPGSEEEVMYFQRCPGSYERYGKDVTLNLASYGIDMVADGGNCYVPIQTLSDFLLAIQYMNVFYNGEAFYVVQFGGMGGFVGEYTPIGEQFHAVETKERSAAMAEFSYGELCAVMDYLYGLKAVHGFESFDLLCRQAGCDHALKGTDTYAADEALYKMINIHLDDGHSNFVNCSPLATDAPSKDAFVRMLQELGAGNALKNAFNDPFAEARAAFYPDGAPTYEEVGNTAYITFDEFKDPEEGTDYYAAAPGAEVKDTIGVMLYAYSQIMRDGSPVENVVLDLSNNSGGSSDMAIFVVSAFLGQGSVTVENTMSGAVATGLYKVDMNLDRQFDDQDLGLTGKNLFCLISPNSFSCGNLVPNVFKNTGKVMLLGRTSGGGSCSVLPLSTVYGTDFRISSPYRLAFSKNGSFYDIDRGAEPDFSLARLSTFYDRAALTDYINDLK